MAAPVRYDVGSDILYIGVTADYKKLWVVSNSNSDVGKYLFWWAYIEVPLNFDGQSHKIVLDSKQNPKFESETAGLNIHFQDGTLYYSAFVTSGKVFQQKGKRVIAFHLDPGSLNLSLNGDGLYVASDIVGDYNSFAHSAQNNLWSIVGGAASIGALLFAGASSLVGKVAMGTLANSIAQAGNDSMPSTKEQMQAIGVKIATEGWNTYATNLNTTGNGGSVPIGSSGSNPQLSSSTLMLVAGLALVLLFALRR